MTLPTSVKEVWLGSQKLAGPTTEPMDVGIQLEGAIIRLVSYDWGRVPRISFHDEKPLMDGLRSRGHVHGARTGVRLEVEVEVGAATPPALYERMRDQAWRAFSNLLSDDPLLTLRVDSEDEQGYAVSRVLYVEVPELRSFNSRGGSHGYTSHHAAPRYRREIDLEAVSPWWMDREVTWSGELALSTTLTSRTLVNDGDRPCPLLISLDIDGLSTVAITHANPTGTPSTITGAGITISGLTFASTTKGAYVIDQYVTDPQVWKAETSVDPVEDFQANIAAGGRLVLVRGSQTVKDQLGTALGGSPTINYGIRRLWVDP